MAEHIDSNPQNVAPVKEVRAHSTFPLSHYIFGTHRFANYNVNFARDVVAKDVFPLRSQDTIDSYTLKAPLMQDIQKTKEYFFVPKQCILPINWDKIERLPALGNDVDATKVNSTVTDFQNKFIYSFANFFKAPELVSPTSLPVHFSSFVRKLLFCELFFSQGSLLAATGAHLSSLLHFTIAESSISLVKVSFDEFFDAFFSNLMTVIGSNPISFVVTFDETDNYIVVSEPSEDFASNSISIHRFLELARDNYNFVCSFTGPSSSISSVVTLLSKFYPSDVSTCQPRFIPNQEQPDPRFEVVDFSIDRCAAYQIVCAHYFSNDSIDYIHDADLWRQNMLSIVNYSSDIWIGDGFYSSHHFSYNGVDTLYDVLSSYWFEKLLASIDSDSFVYTGDFSKVCGYFINLLGWRRSLRFGDYFVGAKARPLAIGDFSVAVNNNAVDVVDITKKISLQRLANNVNRIGNSIKEWYQKIMGSELAYDYHNPMWLASTRSTVYALKNENTNNADVDSLKQVNTSANFAGRDSDFEFTMRPDRNGVVIGITYYDIRRAYMYGIDRMLQHVDRFDGFIPDMQYIGDQDINGNELVAGYGKTHGYTLRNMEYKQFYDECYGGFAAGKLPGFAFLYKPEFHQTDDSRGFLYHMNPISPEFIRSRSDEFDQFYISLAGYSVASYFHFIVKTYNELNASRPMVFAPQIL